jgi:hypothetical protein
MVDQLSTLYSNLLDGSYDCVDRVVLNAYFGMGQTGGGLKSIRLQEISSHGPRQRER